MLMVMDPASAALTVGSELTVDCTRACALATPLRSAEHRQVVTHDRRNRIDQGTRTLEPLGASPRRSVSALASLLHREVRESQHELFRGRVAAPRDLERAAAVGKKGKGAARDRFRTLRTDLAAEHSTQRGAGVLQLDTHALRDGIELEGVHGDVGAS